jgi:outer membrane protein OmpA-like peptidoglycan-associated protein
MTSILINKINKNNLIKQIQNYFNTTYNNLKNKLNSDIKKAKEQAQQAQQAQAQQAQAQQAQAQQAQAQQAQAQQAQAQQQAQVEVIKPVNKTALLIGCNYVGTNYQLSGCINDVENIQNKLKSQYGFNNILIMTDNTSKRPTKVNILNEIKTLLTNANSGDILFLAFSGHGSRMSDLNGEEKDGLDEMFVPLDFNCIIDDEIKTLINNNLKKDVTLFALFDCCHSGTILDLRYQYFDSDNYDNSTENAKQTETVGNVILISGCMDKQYSADAYINSTYQGAMTWAFLDTVNKSPKISWKDLISNMRNSLKTSKYEQIPQLSSGNKLDLTNNFCLL